MLKQSFSRMKKVLAILLSVLFIASVTAVAASAHGGYGWGGYGWGYGPGCMWVGGNNWLCPGFNFTSGTPYTIQTTEPAAPVPTAPSPNLAGVAIFPEPEPTPTNSTSK
jgi:hypothetical protein